MRTYLPSSYPSMEGCYGQRDMQHANVQGYFNTSRQLSYLSLSYLLYEISRANLTKAVNLSQQSHRVPTTLELQVLNRQDQPNEPGSCRPLPRLPTNSPLSVVQPPS